MEKDNLRKMIKKLKKTLTNCTKHIQTIEAGV